MSCSSRAPDRSAISAGESDIREVLQVRIFVLRIWRIMPKTPVTRLRRYVITFCTAAISLNTAKEAKKGRDTVKGCDVVAIQGLEGENDDQGRERLSRCRLPFPCYLIDPFL